MFGLFNPEEERETRMSDQSMPEPVRVPKLWGLWTIHDGCPEGFWLNHTNGPHPERGSPMTWTLEEDARKAAEYETEDFGRSYENTRIIAALICVACE
jgi:hypothetical protein